ncbi:MAG: hypothetical protein J0H67_08430 [Rhodospirillales bacterium]|nr:hypothetical protein [Rhodospirillales bacterium]
MTSTDLQRLEAICATLPPEDAGWLFARLAPAWCLRSQRHAQRAAAIRQALGIYEGWRPTRAADALARELQRVAACRSPISERSALLRRIIDLSNGRPIGMRQIYEIAFGDPEENSSGNFTDGLVASEYQD